MLRLPPALYAPLRAAHERREARERYWRWMDDGMRGDTAYGVKSRWRGKGAAPVSDWDSDHSVQEAYLDALREQAGEGGPPPAPVDQIAQERAGWQALRQLRRKRNETQYQN